MARKDGDVKKGFNDAKTRVDAVYQQPFLAHATMEPVNCTVSVRADGCDIWVGTQVPTRAVDTAVKITGLPADKITVHNHLLGGGFGRRLETDFIAPGAEGRQAGQHAREGHLDARGGHPARHVSPVLLRHHLRRARRERQADRVAAPHRRLVDHGAVRAARVQERRRSGRGGSRRRPALRPAEPVDRLRAPGTAWTVPTAFWRGVGPTRGTFVVESFMDELAAQAKVDPVKYRHDLLGKTPRAQNVLDVAAQRSRTGATRCRRARDAAYR